MSQRYFLLLLTVLSFFSPAAAQKDILQTKISIHKDKASLDDIFNEIERNYDVFFSYTDDILPDDLKISIEVTDQPLQIFLEEILKGTEIVYTVTETHIILINNIGIVDLNNAIHKTKTTRFLKRGFRYPSVKSSKFNIEMDVVVGVSFRRLNTKSTEGNNIISWRKREKPKMGFSTKILGIYHFNSNVIGGIGIGIVNVGEKGKYTFAESNENCRYNDIIFSNFLSYTNSYTYFTVPIAMGYRYSMNKLLVSGQVELLPSFLLGNGKALEYYDYYEYFYYKSLSRRRQANRTPPQSIDYTSFAFGYCFQGAVMYRISKNFTYSLGASYTHYLTSIYKGKAPLKQNSFLVGFTTGIKYSF